MADVSVFEQKALAVSGATDFAGDSASTVEFERDVVIRSILIEKPGSTGLTIDLYSNLDQGTTGATVRLVAIEVGDAVTTAARASGIPVQAKGKGKLVITSTGGTSGAKKVTVLASPAQVGA